MRAARRKRARFETPSSSSTACAALVRTLAEGKLPPAQEIAAYMPQTASDEDTDP